MADWRMMQQIDLHASARAGPLPPGGNRGRRAIGIWLAVLAIAIQCLVVQPHVEWAPQRSDAATHRADLDNIAGNLADPGTAPAICIICQAGLVAGASVLPVGPEVRSVAYADQGSNAVVSIAPLRRIASHSWRSRAPPVAVLI